MCGETIPRTLTSRDHEMLDIDSLAVDPALSEEGTWADFMGAKFKIARGNSAKARHLSSKLFLENWDVLNAGGEDADKVAEAINVKVLANTVLLDWEGVTSGGKELKYSPELGEKYLGDPRYPDLRQFIENYSHNRSNYRERAEQEVAESVKDSAAS